MIAMPNADDFNASWSNRNDGEVLVTWGSIRMTLSAAVATLIHEKFGRALSVPAKAAEMAARPPVPEPERIAEPAPTIAAPLADRKAWLGAQFPFRAKRLQAVSVAIEAAAADMAEVVSVGSILFTMDEARAIESGLRVDAGDVGDADRYQWAHG